ncbi:hypothetical protein RP726_05645 [Candidatus Methylospira mobilis]|uniref:hypothetical protein n=1 Tax=Candidatus Methylospira mobilis TaxID=1808979 RepID=UPI0028E8EA1B|nr:hypothetical protein [Candidatus Methylospira mobilis]WNV05895.1 hypothetical protein RP726_05645 [Candidatus Methylospira mobilis]
MAGAAEGKVVANLFAPAGDWDVPAGFAKNGDTLQTGMSRQVSRKMATRFCRRLGCPGRFREKWRHPAKNPFTN